MAMTKINFQNLPNTTTPIDDINLNLLQNNAEDYINETKTDLTANITKILKALGLDTDTYSSNSIYAVGDLVIYNNAIYECTTAITTAEEWNQEHWTLVPIIVN